MRFRQDGNSFATHVGTLADEDEPAPADPPNSMEVTDQRGMTWLVFPELVALTTIVGTVGDSNAELIEIELATSVTDLTVQLTITPSVVDGVEVRWGDGSEPQFLADGGSHTYAAAGTYTISADPYGPGARVTTDVTVTAPAAPPEEPEA